MNTETVANVYMIPHIFTYIFRVKWLSLLLALVYHCAHVGNVLFQSV